MTAPHGPAVTLWNADDPADFQICTLNPNSLEIRGKSNYSKLEVPGYSSHVVQWSHTESRIFAFDVTWFYARASAIARAAGQTTIATDFDRWLISFTVPADRGLPPPLLVLYWPNFLYVAGAVESATAKYSRWTKSGQPYEFIVSIEMVEVRSAFLDRTRFIQSGLIDPATATPQVALQAARSPLGRGPRTHAGRGANGGTHPGLLDDASYPAFLTDSPHTGLRDRLMLSTAASPHTRSVARTAPIATRARGARTARQPPLIARRTGGLF